MRKILMVFCLFLLISSIGKAQTAPDLIKQQVLKDLQYDGFLDISNKHWPAYFKALNLAVKYEITEAIPLIESKLWSSIFPDFVFFKLDDLKDPHMKEIAIAVVDTAEKFLSGAPRKHENYFIDPKKTINTANYYLFKLGDFRFADKFIQYAKEKGGINNIRFGITMAGKLAKAVPQYRDYIKSELCRIMREDTFILNRREAIWLLYNTFGNEVFSELTENFVLWEDSSGTNATLAYKISSKYPPFETALKTKLIENKEPWQYDTYIKCLLKNYNTMENIQFVASYANQIQDAFRKREILNILFEFMNGDYLSYRLRSLSSSIDTLISVKKKVTLFGWISGHNLDLELENLLSKAKSNLNLGDSLNCARQMRLFQQAVDKEYKDSINATPEFVTIEGWKFLYYNAQYILDRLPQIPAESAADMLDTLSTRLQMSYSNNWIGSQTFVQILEKNIQDAKSKYAAKDSIGCAQGIESFYKLVRLRYLAPGMQFVKTEAYNLLYNYAREITGKVIALPPKSNATLIDQITALKAQIRTDASVKLLGGELLLRGLESSLEIAKQKLQKSDSISSALYITLFQQTARQTYEITKKYPAIRIYVKAGGYISLYYRAEYMLERLTIPIGQPMPKMSKELEEELGKYLEVSR